MTHGYLFLPLGVLSGFLHSISIKLVNYKCEFVEFFHFTYLNIYQAITNQLVLSIKNEYIVSHVC